MPLFLGSVIPLFDHSAKITLLRSFGASKMALEALSKSSNSIKVRKVFVFGFGESYRSVFVGSRLISW